MQNQAPKRKPPTPEEIAARQKADAVRTKQQKTAPARAVATRAPAPAPTAAAVDNRTPEQKYIDLVAPSSITGRLVRFGRDGRFITSDDDEPISDEIDFFALAGDVQIGWIRFSQEEGVPPEKHAGLLYDGYQMPLRESLGDLDAAEWPAGLSGEPTDPWLHFINLILQQVDTRELFTFSTTSKTGRRGVGNLLRHFDRMRRTAPDDVPIVRLKAGGFQHKDDRIGWVPTPLFAVVGRAPRDSAARPDTSVAADLNDQIPF